MMKLTISCPKCNSCNHKTQSSYDTKNNGLRHLLKCLDCGSSYAETSNTFMFKIKSSTLFSLSRG